MFPIVKHLNLIGRRIMWKGFSPMTYGQRKAFFPRSKGNGNCCKIPAAVSTCCLATKCLVREEPSSLLPLTLCNKLNIFQFLVPPAGLSASTSRQTNRHPPP